MPSKDAKADAKPDKDVVKASVEEDEQPVRRSIALRGKSLTYTATPGHLTIRNDKGEPTASMFYTAYTVPSAGRARPVTFVFNGGPGSSTMWLHMGSFGPMKVDASQPEVIAGPPFRYGANPDTLLDVTDLVFIDAPTTGLSRDSGRPNPRISSASTRTPTPSPGQSSATSPNTAAGTAPVHHRRELRNDPRRGVVQVAVRQRRAIERHRPRLDHPQLRPVRR